MADSGGLRRDDSRHVFTSFDGRLPLHAVVVAYRVVKQPAARHQKVVLLRASLLLSGRLIFYCFVV